MDIKQQTKNVAAQGRFGDSMLLHVNPAEVKGLASQVPLTINPDTGQPEAFLPFLAPILGSMGMTALAGTGVGAALGLGGLSAGALAGLGAGLATYAQTGGSGSKALLSGLTAGLGTRALGAGAESAISDAATQAATTGTDIATQTATQTAAQDAAIQAAQESSKLGFNTAGNFRGFTPGESLKTMFTQPDVAGQMGGFDAGMKSLAGAAMTPSGMAAGTAAGTLGVIQSQEEFERQMAQLTEDDAERKRRMYEMYPEQIPIASGGSTSFADGGRTGYRYGKNTREGLYEDKNYVEDFTEFNNPFNTYTTPSRRTPTPIGSGFMPGFMPEYNYFSNINPSATSLGFNPLGTSPQNYNRPTNRFRGMQPMPPRGGFRNEGSFRFTPPSPPMFGGYGNPFMQSPSYQGFYGVPQMQQMLNPYARFTQQPIPYQPYQPYQPPVETPPDDGGDTGGGTGGGIPPIGLPPGDIGGGRKGAVKNPDPVAPPDDFVNPIVNPPVGGPVEPPINVPGGTRGFYDRPTPSLPDPITPPPSITIPIEGGADVTIPDYSRPQPPRIEPPMRRPEPPMSIGGPGGGNMTGREELELANTTVRDMMARPPEDLIMQNMETKGPESLRDRYGVQPLAQPNLRASAGNPASNISSQPAIALPNVPTMPNQTFIPSPVQSVPTPAAPANNPPQMPIRGNNLPQMSIGGPGSGRGGIFGAPMFAEGGDTSKELPNEGLKALYASGEKGKEAVEAMGYQEGRSTSMMQDPITQNVIMFILGEIDDENAINAFVEKYGAEQFMLLRDTILKQAAGNPDAQTEGLIQGMGNSGMADDLPMNIGNKPIAAVSQDEYIVPADVVSMLGDGSSDAGSKQLDGMLDRVRMAKTGGKTQAPPLNPNKVLPA